MMVSSCIPHTSAMGGCSMVDGGGWSICCCRVRHLAIGVCLNGSEENKGRVVCGWVGWMERKARVDHTIQLEFCEFVDLLVWGHREASRPLYSLYSLSHSHS